MRKYGQEIIKATAGKKIHGTGAIPGGINKNLSLAERDELLRDLDQMRSWGLASVQIARDYTLAHLETLGGFGSFPSNHMSLVRHDGAMDLYDGGLRAVDADGKLIFDHVDPQRYLEYIAEDVKPWSYMKFPFIRSLGPEHGWYRVGPLSRVSACDFIDTPLAEAERRQFKAVSGGKPSAVTMAYHWARMIELLHSVEKIDELLHDPDLQGQDLMVTGTRRSEGVAIIEAPRGTLFHHYRVDEHDLVTMANLIVSTTSNNEAMNRAVESVARQFLDGQTLTEGLLNHVEVAVRAYDPCLSCATHALGKMPLVAELVDAGGVVIDRRVRD
jgi:NAD-reducing hydrogenase large subunit